MTESVKLNSDRRSSPRPDNQRTRQLDVVYTFARACESHDQDTGEHLLRIRELVEAIALQLGFDPEEADELGYDAMLHDVGKLKVPAAILQKTSSLSDRERAILEAHTIEGEKMLNDRPGMQRAARIARWHHEAWDGSGYPDGLIGEAIPIEARIATAADIYDALIAERSYKPAWTDAQALDEVRKLGGSILDPKIAAALLSVRSD